MEELRFNFTSRHGDSMNYVKSNQKAQSADGGRPP